MFTLPTHEVFIKKGSDDWKSVMIIGSKIHQSDIDFCIKEYDPDAIKFHDEVVWSKTA